MAGELGRIGYTAPRRSLDGLSGHRVTDSECPSEATQADSACGVQRSHLLDGLIGQLGIWMPVTVAYAVLLVAIIGVGLLRPEPQVSPPGVLDAVHDIDPGLVVPDAGRVVTDVQRVLIVRESTPHRPFQGDTVGVQIDPSIAPVAFLDAPVSEVVMRTDPLPARSKHRLNNLPILVDLRPKALSERDALADGCAIATTEAPTPTTTLNMRWRDQEPGTADLTGRPTVLFGGFTAFGRAEATLLDMGKRHGEGGPTAGAFLDDGHSVVPPTNLDCTTLRKVG